MRACPIACTLACLLACMHAYMHACMHAYLPNAAFVVATAANVGVATANAYADADDARSDVDAFA